MSMEIKSISPQFQVATPEQLAKIKSLEVKIKRLAKQINEPYATLLSIAIFPFFAQLLFSAEGPLKNSYILLSNYFGDEFKNQSSIYAPSVENAIEVMRGNAEQAHTQLLGILKEVVSNLNSARIKNPTTLIDLLNNLKNPTGKFEEVINIIKQRALAIHNICILDDEYRLDPLNLDQYELKWLFDKMETAYNQCSNNLHNSMPHFLTRGMTSIVIDLAVRFAELSIMILGKLWVIDPLL